MYAACVGHLMTSRTKKSGWRQRQYFSILDRCTRDWELIGSVVIDDEVSLILDVERRLKVEQKLAIISEYIELNDAVFRQASVYQKAGLKLYDSLHLACAQAGKTIFLTTDNTIINTARKNITIDIRVDNPVNWLMEVSSDENNQ